MGEPLDVAAPAAAIPVARAIDRKPVFDTVRSMLGRAFTQGEVQRLDRVLDYALGLPAPLVRQIGLTADDFDWAAASLGCTVAQIRAVDEVESGGGWFSDVRADILDLDGPGGFIDGPNLPKILFEAHVFDRHTQGRFRESHPNLSSARWNRALYIGGQAEWRRLHLAMQLDREAALMSASAGRYQIMGFNFALAGFPDVDAFWAAMMASERAHLEAFVAFIKGSNLTAALRQISNVHAANVPFARGYNGSGYAANEYHIRIARAHKQWSEA